MRINATAVGEAQTNSKRTFLAMNIPLILLANTFTLHSLQVDTCARRSTVMNQLLTSLMNTRHFSAGSFKAPLRISQSNRSNHTYS